MYTPVAQSPANPPTHVQLVPQGPGQSSSPVPLPTAEQVLSYQASWTQFYFMVLFNRPAFTKDLIHVTTSQGARYRFEQWSVLKVLFFITLEIFTFILYLIVTLGGAIFDALRFFFVVTCIIFLIHLAWFCVSQRYACCGRQGYLIWAVYLALEPLLLCTGGSEKMLLYIPNVFLVIGCLWMFAVPETPGKTAIQKVAG